ncbi:MAG: hypothetical protein WCT36_05275, partial [Candidatus Gracilibacteria bacterium]
RDYDILASRGDMPKGLTGDALAKALVKYHIDRLEPQVVKAEPGTRGSGDAVAAAGPESLKRKVPKRPDVRDVEPSREEVLRCVGVWVTAKNPPGSRYYADAFGKIKFTESVYTIMMESLIESLDREDDLYVIAKKLTLFHNAPEKWGGDGYSGMHGCPVTKRKIVDRLLKEVKKAGKKYVMEDGNFNYIYSKAVNMRESTIQQIQRWDTPGLPNLPPGNELMKAVLEFVLKKMDAGKL